MNNDIKKIETKIKEIIEKNEDAIKGFEKAAENAKEVSTKSFFEKRAAQRKTFIKTLHNATPALQTGDAEIEGSIKGFTHRTWMDIKAFFSNDTDEAMLEEAIRGDKSAVAEYNEVLAEALVPHRIREIIKEQRDEIQNDLETSEILETFA